MNKVTAVAGGFVVSCDEPDCGRVTGLFQRPAAAEAAVCHHNDCSACKLPLFGSIRPEGPIRFDSTYCAWCGERFHVGCLTTSAMGGTNLWCRICNAEWALTNEVEPDRTVPAWMP